jgi:hypothetical protein
VARIVRRRLEQEGVEVAPLQRVLEQGLSTEAGRS